MKPSNSLSSYPLRRNVLVAMVLGTALSAVGTSAPAATHAPEATVQAISAISRYCTVCWRNARLHPDFWPDCTQEVFTRLLERVTPEAWGNVLKVEGEERREFLRAIDAVKKRTQRSRKWVSVDESLADRRDAAERRRADDCDAIRQAADEVLSERQKRILQLSFEGWSVHEIALELAIPPERVSDEKYKAIRKLREHGCDE